MDSTVMGMSLDWEDFAGNKIFPMAALVVMKGIDHEGDEVFTVTNTEGLTAVDALGMASFAVLHCEDSVRKNIAAANEE